MVEITHFSPITLSGLTKKRVAIYARVSSDKDAAENSLDSQTNYYLQKIANNPNWILAGVYEDNGISGTLTSRPAFNQMMEDARAGKIDYIITKSITRFARNTILLLESIRELKTLGIDVEFENDHLHSMSMQGEMLLSLLASYAEEQSRSASENKRWQIRRYFERGTPTYVRLFGYKMVNNHLEIVPEEAAIVRQIFSMYLSGKGPYAIANTLNDEGKCFWGGKWYHSMVFRILRNEKYKGDMLLQKTYRPDFRTKKGVINHGELDQYLVEGSHEPIISPEIYEAVQQEIMRRKKPASGKRETEHLFTGLIVCGKCKAHFCRKLNHKHPVWKCEKLVHDGPHHCNSKQIRESILIAKTKEVLGLPEEKELTRETVLKNFTAIESVASQLRYFYADGHVVTSQWQNPSRKESWTPEMKEAARKRALSQIQKRKEAN